MKSEMLTHAPDPAKDTAGSLTLFDIERGLVEVLAEYEECQNDEDRANCQNAIEAYCRAEVDKADGIAAYLRHCAFMAQAAQEESERMRERAKAWKARSDRLKDACLQIMLLAGKKKIEGHTSTLSARANGGLAPLMITDASMIPEDCTWYEGKVRGPLWLRTVAQCPWLDGMFAGDDVKMERTISNSAVRESLAKGPVAGAYLDSRGQSLQVK